MPCPPAFPQALCLRRLAQAGACPPGLTGDSARPALAAGSHHTCTWAAVLPVAHQPAARSPQPAARSPQYTVTARQPLTNYLYGGQGATGPGLPTAPFLVPIAPS